MCFNNQLGLLAKVDGATSISTILLVVIDVRSFPPYLYVPIHPLEKFHQNYQMGSFWFRSPSPGWPRRRSVAMQLLVDGAAPCVRADTANVHRQRRFQQG